MQTPSKNPKWKYPVLVLGGVLLLNLAVYIKGHSRWGGQWSGDEWFRKMHRDFESENKSNGFVKVGENAWRLPKDDEVNAGSVVQANMGSLSPPTKSK